MKKLTQSNFLELLKGAEGKEKKQPADATHKKNNGNSGAAEAETIVDEEDSDDEEEVALDNGKKGAAVASASSWAALQDNFLLDRSMALRVRTFVCFFNLL